MADRLVETSTAEKSDVLFKENLWSLKETQFLQKDRTMNALYRSLAVSMSCLLIFACTALAESPRGSGQVQREIRDLFASADRAGSDYYCIDASQNNCGSCCTG